MTQNAKATLDKGRDFDAVFTDAEIEAIRPIASARIMVRQPAIEQVLRRSLGAMASSMPTAKTDEDGGKLKLATYMRMLTGHSEEAIAFACRECLTTMKFFPTISEFIAVVEKWQPPEKSMIDRARRIIATGNRAQATKKESPPLTQEEVDSWGFNERGQALIRAGLACGELVMDGEKPVIAPV